jgi:hypothetical protein
MPHRALAGQSGDRHQAAHALGDLVEARPLGVRPVLAEAGNTGEHQLRVGLRQGVVVDAEARLDVGPEVLDDHVCLVGQTFECLEPTLRLQVQGHAALVAMQVLEVGPVARPAEAIVAVAGLRQLDLDHVGAPVGELPHGRWPRARPRQIEDGEAGQGLGSMGRGHVVIPHVLLCPASVIRRDLSIVWLLCLAWRRRSG